MAHGLCVPHLSYEDLRSEAAKFLGRYHLSGSIPVPIEEIVELRFHLDVIPTPGLQETFDVDAFITSDMESVYVDEFIYQSRPNRYRFSLAHEIAHAILHQKIYRSLAFHDIAGWKAAQTRISEEQQRWLEWHGHAFAGLILVPEGALKKSFESARRRAATEGITLSDASEPARRMVAGSLASEFEVSTDVIEKRLAKDSLWPT